MGNIRKLVENNAKLRKDVENYVNEKVAQLHDKLLEQKKEIDGIPVILSFRGGLPVEMAKQVTLSLRKDMADGLVLVAGERDGSTFINLLVGDELIKKGHHAGNTIKELAKQMGGGGGGQDSFATYSGNKPEALLDAVRETLRINGLNNVL